MTFAELRRSVNQQLTEAVRRGEDAHEWVLGQLHRLGYSYEAIYNSDVEAIDLLRQALAGNRPLAVGEYREYDTYEQPECPVLTAVDPDPELERLLNEEEEIQNRLRDRNEEMIRQVGLDPETATLNQVIQQGLVPRVISGSEAAERAEMIRRDRELEASLGEMTTSEWDEYMSRRIQTARENGNSSTQQLNMVTRLRRLRESQQQQAPSTSWWVTNIASATSTS